MEHKQPSNITQDEKLFSLLSHILGIVFAIVFYFVMKDSKFVRFHALQAFWFQILELSTAFVLFLLIFFFTPLIDKTTGNPSCFIFFILMAIAIVVFGGLIYSVILGVSAFQGRLKEYPIVGRWAYDKVYKGLYF